MFLSFFLSTGLTLSGLIPDSSEHDAGYIADSLEMVTVTADKGITISKRDTIQTQNTLTLSEALMMSPSLQVHDNGGFSGLKSVSLRGMGSAHTAIYIDGIRATNVQSGQNDLETYSINNSLIVIDYAQNSININTVRPTFDNTAVTGQFQMLGGSFGTYLPSARVNFRLSDNISLSANASGIFSKGNFTYGDGLTRVNNDITRFRGGLDLFGLMSNGHYHIKTAYNNSDRGTPGSLSWPSTDRQKDQNAYLQGSATIKLSRLYKLRLSAKGAFDKILYLSEWGDSRYEQSDVQINTAHEFNLKNWWTLSFALDACWNGLDSDSYDGNRGSSLAALASAFRFGRLSADLALEYCCTLDKGGVFRDAISPSANIRFVVTEGLVISALGRRMYRIPTFNELYYPGYGNPELNPEDAWTGHIGADYGRNLGQSWKITAGVGGFYTDLTDKIISAPTEADPNIWLPYNIGKVHSIGIDSKAGISYMHNGWSCGLNAGYSLLSSIDKTTDSYSYGTQVAYTAKHSLVTTGNLSWKGWGIHAIWNMKNGYCCSDGRLQNWNTLDLTLNKEFSIKKAGTFILSFSSKNITNAIYEIVSNYPMPGRSFIGGIEYRF